MSSLQSRVNEVKTFLVTQHCMNVDDEWILGCVEYLTEDTSSNYSDVELKNLAREQWLLNDLNDICPGSLPGDLKEQRKTVLNGRFVLQINAAIDVGTPTYQQYLKFQKVNMENVDATSKVEDKVPSHRMIKLYLTDGVQEITAIEYKPMRNLPCDITPGCKVLLKGPVECRRGVLLLSESNVELLGGEVQEMAGPNSLAGLISAKLGLTITQEPNLNAHAPPRNTNIPTPHAQMPSSTTNQDTLTFEPTSDQNLRPVARVTSLQVAHNNFADDEIDVDQLAAIEAQFSNPTTKRPSEEHTLLNPEKKIKMGTTNDPNQYPEDNDIFMDEDEEYLRELEAKFDGKPLEIQPKPPECKYPIPLTSEPYVYIKQINDMGDMEKAGKVFRVKGQIMKLLSKLSVGKDGWSLRCTIIDGTGNLDVEFTSEVLSKLVGITPNEMTLIKKEMASKPELKQKAVAALQKAKDNLQVLYCIIEITILDTPKITSLIPFEHSHVHSLQKRVKASAL